MNSDLVSFIIPTYQNVDLLKNCITSLLANALAGFTGSYEIIVVDDGSTPPIQDAVAILAQSHGCKVILKPQNESYTQAVNSGLQIAQGSYCILVNNDIEFCQAGWLLHMLSIFESDPGIGIAGCRLLYPNGQIQHGGMDYFLNGKYTFVHRHVGHPRDYPPATQNCRVIAVTGALMMIRRKLLMCIGPLDVRYRLVCSDTDLCLRAQRAGCKVMYCGQAEAIHLEGATRGNTPENKIPSFSAIENGDVDRFYDHWHDVLPEMASNIANI